MPFDATSSPAPLDSTLEIVAPENVGFKYRLAGPFVRAIAFGLDAAFIALEIAGATLFFGVAFVTANEHRLLSEKLAEQLLNAAILLNSLAAFWFWNAAFEAFCNGRTLGKMALGLRVLTTEGRPIGLGQAVLRNIVRTADLALGPFVALIFCSNDRLARLGDLVAGTVVVAERAPSFRRRKAFERENPEVSRIAALIPDEFEFSEGLDKALALYASRRTEISPIRRASVAAPLANALAAQIRSTERVDADALLLAFFRRSLETTRSV